MKYVEQILEKLKEKEAAEHKFRRLDEQIISTLTLKDFFEQLLSEMITIFDTPYIWLTAIEESRLAELIRRVEQSLTLKARAGFIPQENYNRLINDTSAPAYISDIEQFSAIFPETGIYPVKSMAACPVQIDGEIAGSINFGDIAPSRFSSEAETEMLAGVMLKISMCLSNVAAHEELAHLAGQSPAKGQSGRLYPINSGRKQNSTKQTA